MSERKAIPKSVRFEVFKRDSFTCQYCGRSAPDVVLQVDHIQPVSHDGDNNILNLITSCFDCNIGKSDKLLSDETSLQKQKKQLDELQEKREQLEMIVEWQRSLMDLDGYATNEAVKFWDDITVGYSLTDSGKRNVAQLIRKHGLLEILECMKICQRQYIEYDAAGNLIKESVVKAFDYVGRVARSRERSRQHPHLADLYSIKGLMQARGFYLGNDLMRYLELAHKLGVSLEELRLIVLESHNWSDWRQAMEVLITSNGGRL